MANELLETKIDELEKRIDFLYGALDKQLSLNEKLIDNLCELKNL